MRLLQITLAMLVAATATSLFAQTGIGTFEPDPNFALHVKANGSQEPLKLEGLKPGTAETSVLVTDANGGLRYRPAADLMSGSTSLWINTLGDISPESNRPVGIGQTAVPSGVQFAVLGNQRMEGASQLQFRGNQNYIYSPTSNNYWNFVGRDYVSFRDRTDSDDILTVRAATSRVGILNDNPSTDFEVSGTQLMTGDERLQFRDGTNYINSPGNNNNWYFHGQQYVVFRDRNDAVDILTIQANTDRVGILNRNPQVDFEVSGTQRMTGANHLELGSTFNHIYALNNQDLRINGFTETNFMNRAETSAVLSIDANTERVGVLTNDPNVALDVRTTEALTSTGGGIARFGEDRYVGISQSQIGAYLGSNTRALHLQQFGNNVVIGASSITNSLLDARGSAKIGVMAPVTSDDFLVTANTDGDLRKITWANAKDELGDNLGDHTATEDINIEAEHQIQFNATDKYIGKFAGDIDLVNLSGGVHVHAEDFIVTNESIGGIAHFDGGTRRVGFGDEIAPDATVHIDPVSGDFPLRVEDIPIAQGGGQYRRLIIDNQGYVFRARNTVSQNGLIDPKDPQASLRMLLEDNPTVAGVEPEQSSIETAKAVHELQTENMELRLEIQESKQQQREAMLTLEAKLAALTSQIDKLYSETGVEKEQVKLHVHGKACLQGH